MASSPPPGPPGHGSDRPTRDRIVSLLRRAPRTVEELAEALAMTDNAIRPHLAALERTGLAETAEIVRDGGVGKPARRYRLTIAADRLPSAAYEPVLVTLVAELSDRLERSALEQTMRNVGKRLVAATPVPEGTFSDRVHAAGAVLAGLGGDADIVETPTGYTIQGYGCPLSAAVAECSSVCSAAAELITGITGGVVTERCDHGERPRCRFEVAPRPTE